MYCTESYHHAIEQIIAHDCQYREVANLLDAVKQFMSHFDKYMHISMIADIQKRVDKICLDLTKHVRKNFRDLAKVYTEFTVSLNN